jgi:hypothetical protein
MGGESYGAIVCGKDEDVNGLDKESEMCVQGAEEDFPRRTYTAVRL